MAISSVLATGAFWTAAGERAIRTFAQTMIALITVSDRVIGLLDVNWPGALSAAGFAALYSLLMSVAFAQGGNPGPSGANERLAIRPQTGRHAKRDPEDEPAAEQPAAVEAPFEPFEPDQPRHTAGHVPPPLPPVERVERYREGPTERNLRPVNVPLDHLLDEPSGAHRVQP